MDSCTTTAIAPEVQECTLGRGGRIDSRHVSCEVHKYSAT